MVKKIFCGISLSIVMFLGADFDADVHSAARSFHQQHQASLLKRYFYSGVIVALFMGSLFRSSFTSVDHVQLMQDYETVRKMHTALLHSDMHVPKPRGFVYSCCREIWNITRDCALWFVRDGMLGNAAYALMLPLIKPIQAVLGTQYSVSASDVWFLREQVRNSQISVVLVSADLRDFVHELQAWDIELASFKSLSTRPMGPELVEWEAAYQRIYNRVARLVGHVLYREQHTTYDISLYRAVRYTLQERAQDELIRLHDASLLPEAVHTFEEALHSVLLLLGTLPDYRINPWPPSVAYTEYLRLMVARLALSYGSPVM